MTAANPHEPAPYSDERLIYRRLLEALHLAVHEREDLSPAAAIFSIVNLAVDVAAASGTLWASADLLDSMRELIDHLEQRKTNEEAPPLLATLRETLASARPAYSH